jgi:uncharacterized RDD family membrane protein YckC
MGVAGEGHRNNGATDGDRLMYDDTSYAGLWPRFCALSIDTLLFCLFFFPTTKIVKGVWLMSPSDHRWVSGLFITDPLCVAFLIVMFAYFVVLEGLAGRTVGKWVMGLRVIAADGGGRPGLMKGLVRNLLRLVDGLPAFNIVGVALILRSKERARFGDRYAGTRVVDVRQQLLHSTNVPSVVM